jgi:hypothetical protein
MECWASILTLTFGTTRTAELSARRASRTLPPGKFLGTHFCYRLSGPHRESNPESPVLGHSASTNCTTAHPKEMRDRT